MNKFLLVAGLMLAAGTASAGAFDFNAAFDGLNSMNDAAKGLIRAHGKVNLYAAQLGGSVERISLTSTRAGKGLYAVETSNGCEFSVVANYNGPELLGVSVNKDAVCR